MSDLAEAYGQSASAWAGVPARIYGRLAEHLVAFSPAPLTGCRLLDHGSGTGVASYAAHAAGARLVAVDLAPAMLRVDQATRPPGVAGDALRLPFRADAFDVALAAFSLNHFDDPTVAVREVDRVASRLLASTYAADDDHPVKHAVDAALTEAGWTAPSWYTQVKRTMRAWGTVAAATVVVERSGMEPVRVERHEIECPVLTVEDLVAWRLGMAHTSAFFRGLERDAQRRVVARAAALLGPDPVPLVRRVIFLAAVSRRPRAR